MKCKFRIACLLLALLLLLSSLVGCSGYSNPLKYLKDSTQKTIKKALLGELISLFLNVTETGMVTVEFGGTDLVQNLPDSADLKLWVDTRDSKLAAQGNMTLAGEKYDYEAYLNETELAVVSSALFGSNTLGVDFFTLKNDLKTSIFSNNSGTVFANETVSDASADQMNEIKKGFFELLAYNEKTLKFADEVLDVFLEQLTVYAANTRYKENGYTHITLSVNNDSLARTLRATRAILVKDTSFCKYVTELYATLDMMVSASTGVTSTDYSTQAKYYLSSEEDINELCQKIDDAEPFTLEVKTAIKRFGMALTDVGVTFVQGNVTRLNAAFRMQEDALSLALTLDDVSRNLSYTVEENGFRTYRAVLGYRRSAPDTPDVELTGELTADKRADTYTLTLNRGETTRVFGGQYSFGRDKMMLSVESATINGESRRISLKITAKAGENVPKTPKYVNVATMDVTRFTPIYERSTATRERLRTAWAANGLSLQGVLGDVLGAIGLPEEIPTKTE